LRLKEKKTLIVHGVINDMLCVICHLLISLASGGSHWLERLC